MRVLLFSLMLCCSACTTSIDSMRSEALRDAESYAIASCLGFQTQLDLDRQTEAWGSAVIERTELPLDALLEIAELVRAEVAKGAMPRGWSEPNESGKVLPLLYCGEIIDKPVIRASINRALTASKN